MAFFFLSRASSAFHPRFSPCSKRWLIPVWVLVAGFPSLGVTYNNNNLGCSSDLTDGIRFTPGLWSFHSHAHLIPAERLTIKALTKIKLGWKGWNLKRQFSVALPGCPHVTPGPKWAANPAKGFGFTPGNWNGCLRKIWKPLGVWLIGVHDRENCCWMDSPDAAEKRINLPVHANRVSPFDHAMLT